MRKNISRQEFLKLALFFPLLRVNLPTIKPLQTTTTSNPSLPNFIILVFDTLSAKHMSLYGYPRETTPNIERFAQNATVFHTHYAAGNFTSPGTASIFSGTYPWSHRAIHTHGTMLDEYSEKNFFSLFPDSYYKATYTQNLLAYSLLYQFENQFHQFKSVRDLALLDPQYSDLFFPNDYNVSFWSESVLLRTGSTKSLSLFHSIAYRLYRAASKYILTHEYRSLFPRGIPNLNDIYYVLENATDWINNQLTSMPQPYLTYFHMLPPHEPYFTRYDFVDIFKDNYSPGAKPEHIFSEGYTDEYLNQQRREYDEYIAYVDAEFGRIFDFLKKRGRLNNTYVILTSDHGEMFERGIRGHVTRTLYEPIIQVPLIISTPEQEERKDIFTPTSCVDLLPTLLQVLGQPIPDWVEGMPLSIFGKKDNPNERSVFAVEAKTNPKNAPLTKASIGMRKGDYKLIHYMGYGNLGYEFEFYNLKKDPDERDNIFSSSNHTANEMKRELDQKLSLMNKPFSNSR